MVDEVRGRTFDEVFGFFLAMSRINDTFDNMEVALALALSFSRDHVLLKLLGLRLLATMIVHVACDGAFEVIIQLPPAFVRCCSLVVFPRGVVVGLVLPLDL